MNDHQTQKHWAASVRPLLKSTMLIEIPRAPYCKKEVLPYVLEQKYEKSFKIRMSYGNYCLECDEEITSSDHFM